MKDKKIIDQDFYLKAILFLFTAGVNIIIAMKSTPLLYMSDSASSISVAAFLAGYDWSDTVSTAGYYGFGYLFIFAPLFFFGVSPLMIYRVAGGVGAILVGITPIIAFNIQKKYIPEISLEKRFAISLISGSVSICNVFLFSMRNEEPLLVSGWLILAQLFAIICAENNKTLHQIALVLLLIYTNFLHARAIIFVFSIIVGCFFYWLLRKRLILSWWQWCLYLVGYYCSNLIIRVYQNNIWKGVAKNSSALSAASSGIGRLSLDFTSIKGMAMIDFGILFTQYSLTVGTVILASFAVLLGLLNIKKVDRNIQNIIVIGITFGTGWLMLVMGQGVTWLPGVKKGLELDTSTWVYYYKAFTYTRYSGPFVPMLVLCGLVLYDLLPQVRKRSIYYSSLLGLVTAFVWKGIILPYRELSGSDYYFFPFTAKVGSKNITKVDGLANIVLFLSIIILLIITSNNNRLFWCYITTAVVLMANYEKFAIYNNNIMATEIGHYKKADAGTILINKLKPALTDKGIDKIYVLDATSKEREGQHVWHMYQYLNYDISIIHGLPHEMDLENVILFTNMKVESEFLDGYSYSLIDDNEYVYCKGDSILGLLSESGVELIEYKYE